MMGLIPHSTTVLLDGFNCFTLRTMSSSMPKQNHGRHPSPPTTSRHSTRTCTSWQNGKKLGVILLAVLLLCLTTSHQEGVAVQAFSTTTRTLSSRSRSFHSYHTYTYRHWWVTKMMKTTTTTTTTTTLMLPLRFVHGTQSSWNSIPVTQGRAKMSPSASASAGHSFSSSGGTSLTSSSLSSSSSASSDDLEFSESQPQPPQSSQLQKHDGQEQQKEEEQSQKRLQLWRQQHQQQLQSLLSFLRVVMTSWTRSILNTVMAVTNSPTTNRNVRKKKKNNNPLFFLHLKRVANWASLLCILDCTILPLVSLIVLPLFGWIKMGVLDTTMTSIVTPDTIATAAVSAMSTSHHHHIHHIHHYHSTTRTTSSVFDLCESWIHGMALYFVVPVGTTTVTLNYWTGHRNIWIAGMGFFGILLVGLSSVGHAGETVLHFLLPPGMGGDFHGLLHFIGSLCLFGSNTLSQRLGCDCGIPFCRPKKKKNGLSVSSSSSSIHPLLKIPSTTTSTTSSTTTNNLLSSSSWSSLPRSTTTLASPLSSLLKGVGGGGGTMATTMTSAMSLQIKMIQHKEWQNRIRKQQQQEQQKEEQQRQQQQQQLSETIRIPSMGDESNNDDNTLPPTINNA